MEKKEQTTMLANLQSKRRWNSLPELKKTRYQLTLNKFPSGKDFIIEFNLDSCLKKYDSKTPLAALKTKMLNLREIGEIYNIELPKLLIESWLFTFASFMNFGINPIQARQTALFVYEEINMLNLSELALLFRRIQKGFYGEFYGKFNGQLICISCSEYKKERGAIICRLPTEMQNDLLKTVNK